LILDGKKTLELRGKACRIRERIALICSGTKQVWGVVTIVGSKPMSQSDLEATQQQHCAESIAAVFKDYKKPHGWDLRVPMRFANPISVSPKRGSVIWVVLNDADRSAVNNSLTQYLGAQ